MKYLHNLYFVVRDAIENQMLAASHLVHSGALLYLWVPHRKFPQGFDLFTQPGAIFSRLIHTPIRFCKLGNPA